MKIWFGLFWCNQCIGAFEQELMALEFVKEFPGMVIEIKKVLIAPPIVVT